jgi:hypothetical protein
MISTSAESTEYAASVENAFRSGTILISTVKSRMKRLFGVKQPLYLSRTHLVRE